MSLEDFILSSEFEEEVEFKKDERLDMYEQLFVDEWADEQLVFNEVVLGDVITKEKVSQKGNTYTSNNCALTFYNDEREEYMTFWCEMFGDYNPETKQATVKWHHPLCRLLMGLMNTDKNKFSVNIDGVRDELMSIAQISIIPYTYGSYNNSSFRVRNFITA